jgi:hypothetical protein
MALMTNAARVTRALGGAREREVVTSNDKPRIVDHIYIIEASINESKRHTQAAAWFKP